MQKLKLHTAKRLHLTLKTVSPMTAWESYYEKRGVLMTLKPLTAQLSNWTRTTVPPIPISATYCEAVTALLRLFQSFKNHRG